MLKIFDNFRQIRQILRKKTNIHNTALQQSSLFKITMINKNIE